MVPRSYTLPIISSSVAGPYFFGVLRADLGKQRADAGHVPLVGRLGTPGRLRLRDKLVNQVTHAPIVRDPRSRCKVMPDAMLPDARA